MKTFAAGSKPVYKDGAPFDAQGADPICGGTSQYLTHPVFNTHHSETEMMRYIRSLERKDVGLDTSMIPLGSCTMKLNAAAEMLPVTWPEFSRMHPFAPVDQAQGYAEVFRDLEAALCEITGFAGMSLQPNSGAQGEFAGPDGHPRLSSRARRGDTRDVVLIPSSAHGTNPASAVDGRPARRRRRRATATATSSSTICAPRRSSTATRSRR